MNDTRKDAEVIAASRKQPVEFAAAFIGTSTPSIAVSIVAPVHW